MFIFHLGKRFRLPKKLGPHLSFTTCVISKIILKNRTIVPTEDEVRSICQHQNLMIPLNHVFRIDELEDVNEEDTPAPKWRKRVKTSTTHSGEFFKRF